MSQGLFRHPERGVSSLVSHAGRVFAVEPFGVVRFDPERPQQPSVVLARERMFASLAFDDTHVYAALVNEGTIVKVPHEGGASETLASGRGRPLSLALADGWLAWLDQPSCRIPSAGHRSRSRARPRAA